MWFRKSAETSELSKDIQNNEMFLFNWVTKREQICTNNREECIRKPTLSCDAKRLFHLLFHALFFHWNLLCIKQNVVAKRFLSLLFLLSSLLHIFFFSHPPTTKRLGWPGPVVLVGSLYGHATEIPCFPIQVWWLSQTRFLQPLN